MSDLVFQSYIPANIRSKAVAKVIKIAKRFKFDPNALMIVIYKESKWNPKAQNSIKATGLIQWTVTTAKNVHGLTPDQIKAKGILEQLDLVEQYYAQPHLASKVYSNYFDVYFAVFTHTLIGKSDNYVFAQSGSSVYQNNSGLDVDNDGKITVGNIKTWFKKGVPDWQIAYEQYVAPKVKYMWWIVPVIVIAGIIYYRKSKIILSFLNNSKSWF